MTIQQINQQFNEQLSPLYDQEEIQAIFRFYIEIKLNVIDSILYTDQQMEYDLPDFEKDLIDLKNGKPVQQVVGKAFFYDYFFYVNEHTLIPRPETEELIYMITEKYERNAALNIIDLGTGTGCIPITLAKLFPNATIKALDISSEALEVAKRNNLELGTNVEFIQQDLLQPFTLDKSFDIIISNPPYIRELEKQEMHQNVLHYEPHLALFVSNDDPLIFYRKVAEFGINHLNPQGKIFCEINQYLGQETKEMFKKYFQEVYIHNDISGNNRIAEVFQAIC